MNRGKPPIKDPVAWELMKRGYDVEIRRRDRAFIPYEAYSMMKRFIDTHTFKLHFTEKEMVEYYRELKSIEKSIRNRYLRLRKWRERGGVESELINREGK